MTTNYYFKIDTPVGVRYCCFAGGDYYSARRRALFTCFFDHEVESTSYDFKKATVDEKYAVLMGKYSKRIEDTTKDIYDEKEKEQED